MTVAVVYVMCVTSLSWRDALKAVRGARTVANPNVGFLRQLQDYESERLTEVIRILFIFSFLQKFINFVSINLNKIINYMI